MDGGKLALLAAVGVGGYFGYVELVKPYLAQKQLEAEARALAAKKGITVKQALAQLGKSGCQAYAASNGVKSPLTDAACGLAGEVAALAIIKGAPLALKGMKETAKGVVAGAKGVEHGVVAGAKGIGHAVAKLKFWGLEGLSC